jgi:hypothetical protein
VEIALEQWRVPPLPSDRARSTQAERPENRDGGDSGLHRWRHAEGLMHLIEETARRFVTKL